MRDFRKAGDQLFVVFSLVAGEYLKEMLAFVHMMICKMSSEMFTFIVICIIAIAIGVRKQTNKQPTEQD